MVYIVRKEHFNAAHRLWRDDWDEAQNFLVFGKCSNKNWHGHNFELMVTVKGEPNPETGFVMDLKRLSAIIKEEVTSKIDHKNMNLDIPFMQGIIPTTENLIQKIWQLLELPIAKEGATLAKIRLEETENNFVEYYGSKDPY